MRFIKENWFKFGILVISLLYVITFLFQQYIEAKQLNLSVLSEVRQCNKDFPDDERFFNSCRGVAHDQLIQVGHIIKW